MPDDPHNFLFTCKVLRPAKKAFLQGHTYDILEVICVMEANYYCIL